MEYAKHMDKFCILIMINIKDKSIRKEEMGEEFINFLMEIGWRGIFRIIN
jgi:hypothetical protein